jgi:hypothetical protein
MILAVALGALVLAGPAEPVSANQVARAAVSLTVDNCPDVPRDELARMLVLELETPVLPPGQVGDHAVDVRVGCAGTNVSLAVDDPAKGIQLRRLAVFPPEHQDVLVRLVALAIAELVLTSRIAISFAKEPEERADAVTPAPQRPPADGARPSGRAYVLAFGQAVGPFSGAGLGWGGGLRFAWAFGRRWLARPSVGPVVDAEVAAAETTDDRALGSVRISLWSATLRGLLRLGGGRTWLDVGAGGRFGLAQLQGQPADPATARGDGVVGSWAGPVAYVGLGARFRHVVMELGVEGGRVLRGVSGIVDGGSPVSINGNWACAMVAAGWGE